MELFFQQIALSLAIGSIYGLFALSLVISRLALGQINFAQGEIATLSTYISWFFLTKELPFLIVFPLTIVCSFFIGVLLERVVYKPVEQASFFAKMTVFIGLLLAINGFTGWVFGYMPKGIPSPFPEIKFFPSHFISTQQIGILSVTITTMIALACFFRFTKTGLKMRATAENPLLCQLCGISISRMWAISWGLAAAIGSIAGMLIAPVLFLEPNMMGEVLFFSLAATVIGGVESPVGVVLGGFIVSLIENLLNTYITLNNELRLPIALVIIVIVLLIKPTGLFGKKATS